MFFSAFSRIFCVLRGETHGFTQKATYLCNPISLRRRCAKRHYISYGGIQQKTTLFFAFGAFFAFSRQRRNGFTQKATFLGNQIPISSKTDAFFSLLAHFWRLTSKKRNGFPQKATYLGNRIPISNKNPPSSQIPNYTKAAYLLRLHTEYPNSM